MKDSREGKPKIEGRTTKRGAVLWRCILGQSVGWGWSPGQAYMNWWLRVQRDAG